MSTAALERLQPAERHLIEILAVAEDGLTRSILGRMLGSLGVRVKGRAPSTAAVDDIATPLLQQGLLIDDGRLCAAPEAGEAAFREMVAEGRCEAMYARLSALEPLELPRWHGGWYHGRPGTLKRELRHAMLSGDLPQYKSLLRFHKGPLPLRRWFTDPLQTGQLDRLASSLREAVLAHLARDSFEGAWSVSGLATYTEACKESRALPLWLESGASLAMLAGEFALAERLLAALPDDTSAVRAWLQLVRGDLKGAATSFAKVLAEVRGRVGKRNIVINGAEGALMPLAFILEGSKTRRKQAVSMLTYGVEEYGRRPGSSLSGWPHLLHLVEPERKPLGPAMHPFGVLLEGLVARWSDKELPEPRLNEAIAHARRIGWGWVVGELESLRGGESVAGAVSLVQHRASSPTWARRLAQLEEALSGETPQKTRRIAWTLRTGPDGVDLEAREQTRGKKGGWSKGRTVALSRLHGEPGSVAGMSDADLRVVAHLKARSWRSYRGYTETEYLWGEGVWAALAGHDAVFSPDGRPLTIVRLEPSLVQEQKGGQLHVKVSPPPGSGVVVQPVGDQGHEVVEFSPKQLELAALLGGGLSVPKAEAPRLDALMERMGEHFRLSAGGAGAREVDGDPRPVVRLWPEGRSVKARVGVTPAGPGTAMLEPGAGATTLLARVDGRPARVARDLEAEAAARAAFDHDVPSLLAAEWNGAHHLFAEAEDALPFLEELGRLSEDRVVVEWPEGASLRLRASVDARALTIAVRTAKDWFTATGSLRVDEALTLRLDALLRQVQATKGRFLRLDDGSFVALTERLRQQLDALARVNGGRGQSVKVHPLAAETLAPLVDEAARPSVDQGWREGLARLRSLPERPTLPEGFAATLRPYQHDGYVWLARLAELGAGACLADDMGLGKTVMALALLLRRARQGPALVVAPTSVCGNWAQEAWRFAPGLRVLRFGAGDRQAMLGGLQPGDLVVCSYGLLVTEAEALAAVAWATVVLDEAQAIKNPATQRHKAALGLQAGFRLGLTGTPLENHLGELHALFGFLNPGFLGSIKRFNAMFRKPVEAGDRDAQRQLARLIAPFVLRRTKSTVLQELPSRTEVDVLVEPAPAEAAFLEVLRRRALAELEQDARPGHVQVLAQLTRLRLAACSPRLVEGGEHVAGAGSKLEAFGELVEQLEQGHHRALVFSQFVKHLALLRAWLDARGVPYQYLDGATPAKERDKRVAAFQAGAGRVFLISLRAGGAGLNLTAADYVIHVDPWWNPAVEDQASDRAHRIGQTRPVTIYRLISEGSIEQRILALHRSKRALADKVLAGTDAAGGLSAEEMLELIREG
ncbi:MAG: DEAD/DEAH box helicase [Alphaproteobacteria bacterium]|nr:DEAD/DEAH box helicase [Alphaproteobacteria bacterium]